MRPSRINSGSAARSRSDRAGRSRTNIPITPSLVRRFYALVSKSLMRDALNRRFDVVLAESLDRFSRDQEDTAGLFKRLTFAGVNIVTLAEGDITHLHIGIQGDDERALPERPRRQNASRFAGPCRGREIGRRSLLRISRRQVAGRRNRHDRRPGAG